MLSSVLNLRGLTKREREGKGEREGEREKGREGKREGQRDRSKRSERKIGGIERKERQIEEEDYRLAKGGGSGRKRERERERERERGTSATR